jgi:beta-lactamase superfamily II metal-dependent hydrolase
VNNTSIALGLRYGGRRVLLMGDVESPVEAALIEAHDAGEIDLAASVLKVAHHGSSRSTSSELLERVFPNKGADTFAIISSGRRTFTGSYLPTDPTIERLHAALPARQLLSTENRDQHKVVGTEHGDDHVLVRVKASGAVSVCYLP